MPKAVTSLVGRKFGWLRVIKRGQPHSSGRIFWRCRCKCGSERDYRSDGLKCGDWVSCGCKRKSALFIHGLSRTPEHRAWSNMIERCYTKTHKNYPGWGGRGIKVCARWRRSFKAFYRDMGPRHDGLSLHRIKNNDHYRPGNCKWASPKEQASNRRPARRAP